MATDALVFDVQDSDIQSLCPGDLEHLVVLLCEAEVSSNGVPITAVKPGGDLSSPDDGIDVLVSINQEHFRSDFLPSPKVVFQVKRTKMPPSKIRKEMQNDGEPRRAILEQVLQGATYIIVSSQDNCGSKYTEQRCCAMKTSLVENCASAEAKVDFYTLSKLCQWVRRYPTVNLWVRAKIGKIYFGWLPYEKWSSQVQEVDHKYIHSESISLDMPGHGLQKLTADKAIEKCRDLARAQERSLRISGQSGIGKTRFVEALFDSKVGSCALDHTTVAYKNIGEGNADGIDPLIEHLLAFNRKTTIVLDDCPPDVHKQALKRISNIENVGLISIDYDTRENAMEGTWDIRLSLANSDLAEQVLKAQFPKLGYANYYRIAELTDGNPLLARLLAERVADGEDIRHVSDATLFDRLFLQRNAVDRNMQVGAEILSVVYSFSFDETKGEESELAMLAKLNRNDTDDIYRTAKKLRRRMLIRRKGNQQAIFPQALALRLARSAMENFSMPRLKEAIRENTDSRLFRSFSHRLGMLHDVKSVQELVHKWLDENGLLYQTNRIDKNWATVLRNIAPVAEYEVLLLLEQKLAQEINVQTCLSCSILKHCIGELLTELAYDESLFQRCVELLAKLARGKKLPYGDCSTEQNIGQLYQPYMSGTHASVGVRASIMKKMLMSSDSFERGIGVKMWCSAMKTGTCMLSRSGEFGSKNRDYGAIPNDKEYGRWRLHFFETLVEVCVCSSDVASNNAKSQLSKDLVGLWKDNLLKQPLLKAARRLSRNGMWLEGWIAGKRLENYMNQYVKNSDTEFYKPKMVEEFISITSPKTKSQKMTILLQGEQNGCGDRLEGETVQLGMDSAKSGKMLNDALTLAFKVESRGLLYQFGRGLAIGASDLMRMWKKLKEAYQPQKHTQRQTKTLLGFLSEARKIDRCKYYEILDECENDDELGEVLIGVCSINTVVENEIVRCVRVLKHSRVDVQGVRWIVGGAIINMVDAATVLTLAQSLNGKEFGGDELVYGLSTVEAWPDNWTCECKQVMAKQVFMAVAKMIREKNNAENGAARSFVISTVISLAHKEVGDGALVRSLIDEIMDVVDDNGFVELVYDYAEVLDFVIIHEIEYFLEKVHEPCDEYRMSRRAELLRRNVMDSSLFQRVVDWCALSNSKQAWKTVSKYLKAFERKTVGSHVEYKFTMEARTFLKRSPFPYDVLRGYSEIDGGAAFVDDRQRKMKDILCLYESLTESNSLEIAKAAKSILIELRREYSKVNEIYYRGENDATGFDL